MPEVLNTKCFQLQGVSLTVFMIIILLGLYLSGVISLVLTMFIVPLLLAHGCWFWITGNRAVALQRQLDGN